MSAKNNDIDRILEIYTLIQTLNKRIDKFGVTRETLLNPKDDFAIVVNENIHSLLYRITEEAHSLSFSVQSLHPNIKWDDVRDFRNFLAHDYSNVNNEIIWDSIVNDIPQLETVCIDFAEENALELPKPYLKSKAPVPNGMAEFEVGKPVAQQAHKQPTP